MSLGVPFTSPLPTPGVTPSPQFESELIAWAQEAEGKLEQLVGDADLALEEGDVSTHGTRALELPAAAGVALGATYVPASLYWAAGAGGDTVSVPLPVQPGQRITRVSCHGRNSGVAWTAVVKSVAKATGTVSSVGATMTSGTSSGTIEPKEVDLTETVVDGVAYVLLWTAGGAGDRFLGARLEVDRV